MKCRGCNHERKGLVDGLCILCRKGPGGRTVEKEVRELDSNVRGKEVFSTRNKGG